MVKIKYRAWDYDFTKSGGYSWTIIDEKILTMPLDELILDLIAQFDCDYIGGIWQCAEYDENGDISSFTLHHKGSPTEYVYDIIEKS